MTRIRNAAERAAQNAIVIITARGMAIFGPPIVLALLIYVVNSLVTMDKRVSAIEGSRVDARAEISRRFDDIARQNQRGLDEDTRIASRLSAVEAGQARAEATSQLTLRAVSRIETQLDNSGRR